MICDFDLFPAKVAGPDGTYAGTRALVTRNGSRKLFVFAEGPRKVLEVELSTFERARARGQRTVAVSTDGAIYEIVRGGGCGCSSKLRGLQWEELIR